MHQLISTHANCLELRQVIKNFYTISKLKVLEQPKLTRKTETNDRKIRSQTKGMHMFTWYDL